MPSISTAELVEAGWKHDFDSFYNHPTLGDRVSVDADDGELFDLDSDDKETNSSVAELLARYPVFPLKIGIHEVHKFLGRECRTGPDGFYYTLCGFFNSDFVSNNGVHYSSCEVLR